MTKNANEKSLLKKKLSELTEDDRAVLEKHLGTSDRPFPMWGTQRVEQQTKTGTQSFLQQVLSVINDDDNALRVYSDRPAREVMALAYCDMPVPSMLPMFKDGLERRLPESRNRTQMMIGDPGHGKSFLGALQGRLKSKEAVEVFDCGGRNMNELLFEMVLDFGSGDALPNAIDKRLKAGTLQHASLNLLEQLNNVVPTPPDMKGDELTEWKKQHTVVSHTDKGDVLIDWSILRTGSKEKIDGAFDILSKISKIENLDNAGGNALGMNSQYGKLIQWFINNREGVLDEYNKSRDGTDNALQTVIQFLIGEIDYCRVDNPLKNKDNASGPSFFEFKREDMGVGFFVTFTGNKTEDGITTRSLNKSVYDRLKPDTLPDPEVMDWQHRICQMMTGVPVSTLHAAFGDAVDRDPNGFGDWLLWLRRTKAEIEGTSVPALQETMLSNWQNVLSASAKLAEFFDKWAKMTDDKHLITNGHTDLIEEVDHEYSKKEGMSLRRIKFILEEALPIRPKMTAADAPVKVSFGEWNDDVWTLHEKRRRHEEKVDENPALNFGSRLVEYIEDLAYRKSGAIKMPKLYNKLLKAMETSDLRDITLNEAARSKQKSVEDLLNISTFAERDLGKQAQMAQKTFCDYIRQIDPAITADDNQIVTVKKLRDALETVLNKGVANDNEVFVINRNPENLSAAPLQAAGIKDTAEMILKGMAEADFLKKDIVHHDDFLASLALPTVTKKNLSSIWETNLREMMKDGASTQTPVTPNTADAQGYDEGMLIAENRSSHGIAATSVVVKNDDEGETLSSVHIIRNTTKGRTLVVSDKAPSKLLAAFQEAGITHVDRNAPNAEKKISAAIADLTRGMPASIKDRLSEAFRYRNEREEDSQADTPPSLPEMMADGTREMMYPKYLVHKNG